MSNKHIFQAPKGTRDFDPISCARRNYIFEAWRLAAVNAGYLEIDGPTFEHLDLYTQKSGEAIVSELFSFSREKGNREYALRPEFTPTLARMAASRGRSLENPTRWFAIPAHFRAERPQRGRLREFYQFNVDLLGDGSSESDAEVISVAVQSLRNLGVTSKDVVVHLSHREVIGKILQNIFGTDTNISMLFKLLDKRTKVTQDVFESEIEKLNISLKLISRLDEVTNQTFKINTSFSQISSVWGVQENDLEPLIQLARALKKYDLDSWVFFDLNIVRGLDYYTGGVFEIQDRKKESRAIAGGGRYDRLVENFGGPSVPACGFGMGDVVLSDLLEENNLFPEKVVLMPRPAAYVLGSNEKGKEQVVSALDMLRKQKIHARTTSRSTTNLGKLLSEASSCGSLYAVILDGSDCVNIKCMGDGKQEKIYYSNLKNYFLSKLVNLNL